ncbi:hypothetical protein LTR17_007537 [Elasticomyces elasticus]|nr:hypothetical protein LTR17_007537 [Elasticomyces elasticus]
MISKKTAAKVPTPPLRRYPGNTQDEIDVLLFSPTDWYFYDGKIRTLSDQGQFDLPNGWNDMLRSMLGPEYPVEEEVRTNTRLRWFEVEGDNVQVSNDKDGGKLPVSSYNLAHQSLVIDEILPALRKLYGKTLRQHVIIFVPYEQQRKVYNAALDKLWREGWEKGEGWETSELPEVWTMTAASEPHHHATADIAIVDLVKSKGGPDLGFLQNDDRAAIMFTRAHKACFVVSGNLYYDPDEHMSAWELGLDPYARQKAIKWEAKRQGREPTNVQLSSDNAVSYYQLHAHRNGCSVSRDAKK